MLPAASKIPLYPVSDYQGVLMSPTKVPANLPITFVKATRANPTRRC